jgi:hypothetical protein
VKSERVVCFVLAALIVLAPLIVGAQSTTTGAIAGAVKDATGAVLPGVTVEAASPALIEKVRTAVTDGEGVYKIADLRPGRYAVTFSLAGFTTVKREGVEIAAGFTAPINADLKVGTVEETVVVTGESPVVDVQNVRTQRVLTRDVIDTIPTNKAVVNLAALVPGMGITKASGVGQDVGGSGGETFQQLTIHGTKRNDTLILLDGLPLGYLNSFAGGIPPSSLADGGFEQVVMTISGHAAESETGGVVTNLIPKQGGNVVHGTMFGNYGNESMQASNYTDYLKSLGTTKPQKIHELSDFNPSVGGPVVKDRLWFFGSFRDLRSSTNADPSTKGYNLNPTGWTFVPDLNKPVYIRQAYIDDAVGRGTWQLNPKNKVSLNYDYNHRHDPINYPGDSATEQGSYEQYFLSHIAQATWSAPVTNKLLFDAGFGWTQVYHPVRPLPDVQWPSATETSTGLVFRAQQYGSPVLAQPPRDDWQYARMLRGSMSYVTGSHAIKVGATHVSGNVDIFYFAGADYEVGLLNGKPITVTYYPTPFRLNDYIGKSGIYAQDQWTFRHLTLNYGLRFDYASSHYPDVHLAATNILPDRGTIPAKDIFGWKDLSPRLGASWDLFGTGKTAIKFSANRYVAVQDLVALTRTVDPQNAAGGLLTRTWSDVNGDFIPQGDPLNPLANGELGPSPVSTYGRSVLTTTYDPSWATGFGTRDYQWEFTGGVQHELLPGMSVSATYFRRIFGNFSTITTAPGSTAAVIDNLLVNPGDYDPFCVTAPVDPRLPGGGGNRICGFKDLKPTKLGQVQNVGQNSNGFGNQYEHWNGVDLIVNARMVNGLTLQGGLSTGKTVADSCAVLQNLPEISPLIIPFCHQETPWLTQVKFLASYRLPKAFVVSGTFQSLPNDPISASYVALNSEVAPSLGRNLSAGPNATATVQILPPGQFYNPRINQVDLRLTREFRFGSTRFRPNIDVYNVTNIDTPLTWNNTYGRNGATWLRPTNVIGGTLLKFGAQFDF